jgi:hypothetical protein
MSAVMSAPMMSVKMGPLTADIEVEGYCIEAALSLARFVLLV